MNSGIYLIQNVKTRLCYVGQASDIGARWSQHRYLLRRRPNGRRVNNILANSWAKHGEDAFRFVILELCSIEELTKRETYWLREFRDIHGFPVANTEGPVDNPWRGRTHSIEVKEKIAEASRLMPRTDEHRARISAANRGKPKSETARANLSAAVKGVKRPWLNGDGNPSRSEAARERMRNQNPAKKPEVRAKLAEQKSKQVHDQVSGRSWHSLSALAAEFGVSVTSASRHLLGELRVSAFQGMILVKS